MKPTTAAWILCMATTSACSPADRKLASNSNSESPNGSMTHLDTDAGIDELIALTGLDSGIESNPIGVLGVAASNDVSGPVDATPSPDGDEVYFLASKRTDADRAPGIFRTGQDGAEVTTMALGAPMSAPVGIAISMDGTRLYLADMEAGGLGAILQREVNARSNDTTSSPISTVQGTEGLTPTGLEVAKVNGEEYLYFTGTADVEHPSVFRRKTAGGDVEILASGNPLASPAGITVAADGTAYVIDALADGGAAALLRIQDGEASMVVGGLGVGFPAGVTLDLTGNRAFISGLDPATGRDVVYVVELDSGALSRITDPVDAFSEPAGLHRAHNANVYAWADSEAGVDGTVFILKTN